MIIDPGEMAQKLQDHSKRVVQGGHHNWAAVNKYQRKAPKPRNWKRLLELVLPMTTDVMREAIKQSTTRECSLGLDCMGKPLWHALAEYLAVPMTNGPPKNLLIQRMNRSGTETSANPARMNSCAILSLVYGYKL